MYLMYLILWIIFNGNLTLEIFLFGVVIAAALFIFICRFGDYSIEKEKKLYRNVFRVFRYIVSLVIEVVRSNLSVMRLIISQKEEIEPVLVTFVTQLQHPTTQALLANTITITPGTITVLLEDGTYTVHCLDGDFASEIDDSSFIREIKEIEEH